MSSRSSITPVSLQGFDFSNPAQAKQYQYQMMQYLQGLQLQVNAFQQALTSAAQNLGAISSNTTVNANNALVVSLIFTFSAAFTLTIQNLASGSIVMLNLTNTSGSAKVLTGVASTPSGAAYTSWLAETSVTVQNLLTGWNVSAGAQHICVGTTSAGPSLSQVAN